MRHLSYKLLPALIIIAVALLLHTSSYADALLGNISGHVAMLTGQTIGSEMLSPPPASLENSMALWEKQTPVQTDFDELRFERLLELHESGGHLKSADMAFMIEASQQKYMVAMRTQRDLKQQEYLERKSARARMKHRRWHRRRRSQGTGEETERVFDMR